MQSAIRVRVGIKIVVPEVVEISEARRVHKFGDGAVCI
jgi:hypothetical protein